MSFSNTCADVSLYHLFNHGFFKALLFLSAGCIIHALNNEQDVRRMGGLMRHLPCSYQYIVLGSLSLMGIPFLSGFFSKDLILESAFSSYSTVGLITFIFGILSAYFTSFYSARLVFSVFITSTSSYKSYLQKAHEAEGILFWPLLLLAIGSIFSGFIFRDLMVGLGSHFTYLPYSFYNWHKPFLSSEFIPVGVKLLPLFVTLSGMLNAYHLELIFSMVNFSVFSLFFFNRLFTFFNLKWFFDILYNHYIIVIFLEFCYYTIFKFLDRGLFEYIGPSGIEGILFKTYGQINLISSGIITAYLLVMVVGIIPLLVIFFFPTLLPKLLLIIFWLTLISLIYSHSNESLHKT